MSEPFSHSAEANKAGIDAIKNRRYIVRPCDYGYEVFDRRFQWRIGNPYRHRMYAEHHADELESEHVNGDR